MFSHVTIGSTDLERARRFYDVVLATIGLPMQHDERAHGGGLGYAPTPQGIPQFWVMSPINGAPQSVGNGVTIAFNAGSRAEVDAFHAAALAAGGSCEGRPGLRPHYHADYYGAYARDPNGNKLCCVCHLPPD